MAKKVEKSKTKVQKAETKSVKPTKDKTPTKATAKTPTPAPKSVATKPVKAKPSEVVALEEERARIYHVTLRSSDGKWQVKFGGSSKPIKLFDTQKEALDYAKALSANYDRSFSIHKKDGKIRKKKY